MTAQPDPSKRLEQLERDLAEATERQTAASQVLEVIGRSAFELEPVFETALRQAVRRCRADAGLIYVLDGEVYLEKPISVTALPGQIEAMMTGREPPPA